MTGHTMRWDEELPLVSVVLPVYNCRDYLTQSLLSLEHQSLRDLEIIAVDDGSSDGSGLLLDEHAARDSRYKVLHVPNGGIVSALNLGIAEARGRYIARMDGDDIAVPDRLARQVAFLDAHLDYVACGSILRMVDEQGRVVDAQAASSSLPDQTDLDIFPPRVLTVPHPTLMVRRDALVRLGGYRRFFPHAEDHDLFLRLTVLGRIALLQEHLLDYRVHAGAISERHREMQRESAFKAQAAALLVHLTGQDAFADGRDHGLEELTAHQGMPPVDAWRALREVWRLEQAVNRRDVVAGWRQSCVVICAFVRYRTALGNAKAWARLVRKGIYNTLRLVRVTVRG